MDRTLRVDMQPGYVLHRRPYGETSLLLEVMAREHGRLPLVARGARRPRRGAGVELQPFRPLLLSFTLRGEVGTLRGSELADGAGPPLAGAALPGAFYASELLMSLLHRFDPHPALFDAYDRLLACIANSEKRELGLRAFEKHLLAEIGYGLVLDRECNTGDVVRADCRYVYVPDRGPVLLSGTQVAESGPVVKGSTLLALAEERFDDVGTVRDARRLMRFLVEHHLGDKPLKSRTLFRVRP